MIDERDEPGCGVLPTMLGVAVAMLICAALLIVGLAVRPSGGLALPAGYHVVHVDEFTYGFRLTDTTLPAGKTLFVDRNVSSIPHEFVLFRTDLPAAHLPLKADKTVNEESASLEDVADSGSDIAPGSSRLITADLAPGHYALVCNLPAHYGFGMHVDVTVK